VADYDRDGRVDVFLPSWTECLPNLLFRNVSRGGHWLSVRVRSDDPDYNAMASAPSSDSIRRANSAIQRTYSGGTTL
jgi:hypothetical protein